MNRIKEKRMVKFTKKILFWLIFVLMDLLRLLGLVNAVFDIKKDSASVQPKSRVLCTYTLYTQHDEVRSAK